MCFMCGTGGAQHEHDDNEDNGRCDGEHGRAPHVSWAKEHERCETNNAHETVEKAGAVLRRELIEVDAGYQKEEHQQLQIMKKVLQWNLLIWN